MLWYLLQVDIGIPGAREGQLSPDFNPSGGLSYAVIDVGGD